MSELQIIKKGIVLAGGLGTRLYPATTPHCKQLLPVFDKPMIYYPVSVLMLAGIRDIAIISTEQDLPAFKKIFGTGADIGVSFTYLTQENPKGGIAEAFLLAENFLDGEGSVLILGDNIFYGNVTKHLKDLVCMNGASIFGYRVKDPNRYGIVDFDENKNIISIEEKPKYPKTNFAIPGLYVYDNKVVSIAKKLQPSSRGELEITDLNREYLQRGELRLKLLGRGNAWLDTGTPESLLEACNYIYAIQNRQGMQIACLEEIAVNQGFITLKDLKILLEKLPQSDYKKYLIDLFFS